MNWNVPPPTPIDPTAPLELANCRSRVTVSPESVTLPFKCTDFALASAASDCETSAIILGSPLSELDGTAEEVSEALALAGGVVVVLAGVFEEEQPATTTATKPTATA